MEEKECCRGKEIFGDDALIEIPGHEFKGIYYNVQKSRNLPTPLVSATVKVSPCLRRSYMAGGNMKNTGMDDCSQDQ